MLPLPPAPTLQTTSPGCSVSYPRTKKTIDDKPMLLYSALTCCTKLDCKKYFGGHKHADTASRSGFTRLTPDRHAAWWTTRAVRLRGINRALRGGCIVL